MYHSYLPDVTMTMLLDINMIGDVSASYVITSMKWQRCMQRPYEPREVSGRMYQYSLYHVCLASNHELINLCVFLKRHSVSPSEFTRSHFLQSTQSNVNHMAHSKTVITEAHRDNYTPAFSDGELLLFPSDTASPRSPSAKLGTLKNKMYCVWI